MLYPVYIHTGDDQHAHGITFPDFPGCFSAADNVEDIPAMIQEAVEAHFADGEAVPPASSLADLSKNPEYQGGAWMLAEIDLTKLSTKSVRLNISLPENLIQMIDAHAKKNHVTRSGFLAQAASKAIKEPA